MRKPRQNPSVRKRVSALLMSRAQEVRRSALVGVTFLVGDVTPPGRLQQLLRGHCPGLAGQSEHRSLGSPEHREGPRASSKPRPGLDERKVSNLVSKEFLGPLPRRSHEVPPEGFRLPSRMVEAVKWGQKHVSGLNPQAGSLACRPLPSENLHLMVL